MFSWEIDPLCTVQGAVQWDDHTENRVLGSFYWGYTAMQLVAGLLAEYVGGRGSSLTAVTL